MSDQPRLPRARDAVIPTTKLVATSWLVEHDRLPRLVSTWVDIP